PGGGPACFGRRADNRGSTRSYYAQSTSEPGEGDRLGAVLGDRPLQHAGPATYGGEFRLQRIGCLLLAWHRVTDDLWQQLGARGDDAGEPMTIGAKIWAHGDCGGLQAEVAELRVSGTPAADQDPVPAFREVPGFAVGERLAPQPA